MTPKEWIDVAIVVVPTLIAAIAWLLRLEMRLRFLIGEHRECRGEREKKEEALAATMQTAAVDIAVVKADVQIIKQVLLNGTKNPFKVPSGDGGDY